MKNIHIITLSQCNIITIITMNFLLCIAVQFNLQSSSTITRYRLHHDLLTAVLLQEGRLDLTMGSMGSLVPAVCAAALTVSCPPHGIRLGRRVGRIPIVAPVQLSETGDMLGAASLKRRSASAMSAACADCVLMLSRSSRVAASPSQPKSNYRIRHM